MRSYCGRLWRRPEFAAPRATLARNPIPPLLDLPSPRTSPEIVFVLEVIATPAFWASLVGVTLIQIALGADNLIIITIIANKLEASERGKAIKLGLILAMAFRIILLAGQ